MLILQFFICIGTLLRVDSVPSEGTLDINSGDTFFIHKDKVKETSIVTTSNAPNFASREPYITVFSSTQVLEIREIHTTEATWNEICTKGQKFYQRLESFLNYMLRVQACDSLQGAKNQMATVCSERKYASNEYYKIAYMRWCNAQAYEEICQQRRGTPQPKSFDLNWQGSGNEVEVDEIPQYETPANMDEHMIKRACTSVEDFMASFAKDEIYGEDVRTNNISAVSPYFDFQEAVKSGNATIVPVVKYSEWYFHIIPFCDAFTCGASFDRYSKEPFPAYNCMPKACRTLIVFSIVFDALLAVLVIVANALVLAVAARTKIMRNIPGYFKISLALADLTVGVFVLPSCIYTTYAVYMSPLPFRLPGQQPSLEDYIPRPIGDFVGFFVVLSFAVSVYTMAGASIDRYLAITKPFEYRQGQYLTKKRSLIAFAIIWLISFVVAIFPVFSKFPYSLSAFNLILSSGVESSIIYAVALLVPLLAVWLLNGAMLKEVCADREKRNSIRATSVIKTGHPQYAVTKSNPIVVTESATTQLEGVPEILVDEERKEVIENGANTQRRKQPATRNVSTSSVVFQKKRSSSSLADGVIERMKRQRTKQSDSISQRRSRRLSIPNSAASVERRLARTLAIMIGAFTAALLPNIAAMIAFAILTEDTSPGTSLTLASTLYITSRILLSNSFWNCIIYSIRNRHFRHAMWAIFLCKREKIDRKLRQSVTMSQQWKRRSANGSLHDKQSLSKTSSTASSYGGDKTRRSTLMWSFSSNSPCSSRKASSDHLSINRSPVGRSVSCYTDDSVKGILKTSVGRSISAPHAGKNILEIPMVNN